ncbi:MAG: hypothetical protein Q9183_004744 [Haloplaca sp. 2 TL-2023]
MPEDHQSHIATLFHIVFPHYISIQERRRTYFINRRPYFNDDEIYCILIHKEPHSATYMAEAMFKMQTCRKLADIESSKEGQQPLQLKPIWPKDIREVWDHYDEWMGRSKPDDLNRYIGGVGKHWGWVNSEIMTGTVDMAMEELFEAYEERYSANGFKAELLRGLRAQYCQPKDWTPRYG